MTSHSMVKSFDSKLLLFSGLLKGVLYEVLGISSGQCVDISTLERNWRENFQVLHEHIMNMNKYISNTKYISST